MASQTYTFEVLAHDPTEKANQTSEKALTYALAGLWDDPKVDAKNRKITDGNCSVTVNRIKLASEEDGAEGADSIDQRSYLVQLVGDRDRVGDTRIPLVSYLKDQKFESLYVTKDEVSAEIADELYPFLYKIENQLRSFLIKFMVARIGAQWWKSTATPAMEKKVEERKSNEKVFEPYIENGAYLIDFGELGKLLYKQSTGFGTRESIVEKIGKMEETPEAIKKLKEELQANYHKYFKAAFAEKKFRQKWEAFEFLRNKIAHNNLFTQDDLERGRKLAEELVAILDEADKEFEEFEVTSEEREELVEAAASPTASSRDIPEEEFLELLALEEKRANLRNGFVGIARFLRDKISWRGYSSRSARELIDRLSNEGKVVVEQIENPHGKHPTTTIRMR